MCYSCLSQELLSKSCCAGLFLYFPLPFFFPFTFFVNLRCCHACWVFHLIHPCRSSFVLAAPSRSSSQLPAIPSTSTRQGQQPAVRSHACCWPWRRDGTILASLRLSATPEDGYPHLLWMLRYNSSHPNDTSSLPMPTVAPRGLSPLTLSPTVCCCPDPACSWMLRRAHFRPLCPVAVRCSTSDLVVPSFPNFFCDYSLPPFVVLLSLRPAPDVVGLVACHLPVPGQP